MSFYLDKQNDISLRRDSNPLPNTQPIESKALCRTRDLNPNLPIKIPSLVSSPSSPAETR